MEDAGWAGGNFLIDGFPRNADNLQARESIAESEKDGFPHAKRKSNVQTVVHDIVYMLETGLSVSRCLLKFKWESRVSEASAI